MTRDRKQGIIEYTGQGQKVIQAFPLYKRQLKYKNKYDLKKQRSNAPNLYFLKRNYKKS